MNSRALWIATSCCGLAAFGLLLLLVRGQGAAPGRRPEPVPSTPATDPGPEEPEMFMPDIADPHKHPLKREPGKEEAPILLSPELLKDYSALLAHVHSLEKSKGGREREAYLRALCEKLEASPEALERFLDWMAGLRDGDYRRIALIVLGRIPSTRAMDFLFGVVENDAASSESRWWALRSLLQGGRIGHPIQLANLNEVEPIEAKPLAPERGQRLIFLLTAPLPPSLVHSLLNLLSQYKEEGAAPPELRRQIAQTILVLAKSSENVEVRQAALNALSGSDSEEAQAHLLDVVESSQDNSLRFTAVGSLRVDASAATVLLRLIPPEKDESVRSAMVDRIPTEAAYLDFLERVATTDNSPRVRISAVSRLHVMGDRGLAVLERVAQSDASESVRDSARKLLSRHRK